MNQQFVNDLAERVLKSASLKPVGETWISFDGTIPFGGIPFLGGSYSKELYKDLYAYAQAKGRVITEDEWQKKNKEQNGNVPYYSDASPTEFRVPRINGYFKGSDSIGEAGKYIPEGLELPPHYHFVGQHNNNNQGFFIGQRFNNPTEKTITTGGYWWNGNGGGGWNGGASYSANLQTSEQCYQINGGVQSVTPETIQVLVGVYAFGTVSNVGNTDIGNVVQQNERISAGLSNINYTREFRTYPMKEGYIDYYKWKLLNSGETWVTVVGLAFIPENESSITISLPEPLEINYGVALAPATPYADVLISYFDNKPSSIGFSKLNRVGAINFKIALYFTLTGRLKK